ncbi:hypothetical protein ACFX13_009651 [Malus domestica]|uniref:Uncharacterized protein n=1 Tax=Malus baccata TaxID=106549 RepID=A0A540MCD4_MALBA|nr:uncharacterized protein LOC126591739 [Malus sylvestris]TQD96390.1 hypothetical protein C1H46_018024 [Malus baccata]TQD96391.1 hypothetical protein C1H46_018025 [Malus baccata]
MLSHEMISLQQVCIGLEYSFGFWDVLLQMDIQARIGSLSSSSHNFRTSRKHNSSSSCPSSCYSPLKPLCSRRDSQEPQQNGDNKGDKFSTDWDKAWANIRKQGKNKKKGGFFSGFSSPNKYVSWNPRQSNYPLSEEVDPIKRTERSNLMLWTSPRFTLAGAIVIVTFLLVYTILYPLK